MAAPIEVIEGLTSRHRVHDLVWYEPHETMESAILWEKRLKEWKRAWLLRRIEGESPEWFDLCTTLLQLDSGLRRNDELEKLSLLIVIPAKAGTQ